MRNQSCCKHCCGMGVLRVAQGGHYTTCDTRYPYWPIRTYRPGAVVRCPRCKPDKTYPKNQEAK